jgi:hypothetical protein
MLSAVFVHRIAVEAGIAREFERELQEMLPPGRQVRWRDVL